ncbi:MAG: peroxidase-related enzyme [Pseudomonadota bacterium]|nr:peroxidase-related enzyme [Pseudomonadota bacterium]
MSWIEEIPPAAAQGELRALYDELERKRGKVANILQVHSLRPASMQAHLALYMELMFAPGGLSRKQREIIAVVVSRENRCDYCVAHHAEALQRFLKDPALLSAIAGGNDVEALSRLTPVDRALMDYAAKLTREPWSMSAGDIQALRESGVAEPDILLANLIVAYFNFVNRIALGLGVEFNSEEVSGYDNPQGDNDARAANP